MENFRAEKLLLQLYLLFNDPLDFQRNYKKNKEDAIPSCDAFRSKVGKTRKSFTEHP